MESIPISIPGNDDRPEQCLSMTPPDAEVITTLEEGISVDTPEKNAEESPPHPKKTKSKVRVYSTLPSSSYSSLMPYQIPQVKEILRACFPDQEGRIIDATAHIGGDAILFSEVFPNANIVAIDVDPAAIECLRKNIANFADIHRFEIICANSVEWIRDQLSTGHPNTLFY